MKQTLQTEGMDIFQHGLLVWKFTRKILDNNTTGMKIPEWFIKNREYILTNCYDRKTIKQYAIFHDIGKPDTLVYDEYEKRHFPNHAEVSANIWRQNGWCPKIGQLIGLDMMFHTETVEQITQRQLNKKIICTILISSLAELHANAEMFGGITSQSFCIKFKRLNQRAKRILNKWQKVGDSNS